MTTTSTATLTIPTDLYNQIKTLAKSAEQSEPELLAEAIRALEREQLRNRFKSIGLGSDTEVTGANSEDWLRDNWNPDTRG